MMPNMIEFPVQLEPTEKRPRFTKLLKTLLLTVRLLMSSILIKLVKICQIQY